MKKFRKLFFILLAILICGGITAYVVINNTPSQITRRDKLKMIEPFLEDIGEYSYTIIKTISADTYVSNYYNQDVYLQLKQDQQFILGCFKRSKAQGLNMFDRIPGGDIDFVFPNGEILDYNSGYFEVEGEAYLLKDNDRETLDKFVNNLILLDENLDVLDENPDD